MVTLVSSGKVCVPLEVATSEDVVTLRAQYGLSQEDFAAKFGLTLSELQRMETASATA